MFAGTNLAGKMILVMQMAVIDLRKAIRQTVEQGTQLRAEPVREPFRDKINSDRKSVV